MDRAAALRAARAVIERAVINATTGVAAAIDEATNSESVAENEYDTRSVEASYLAAGQGRRALELKGIADFLRSLSDKPRKDDAPIGLGALVRLEDEDGDARWYLLAPDGGGTVIDVDGEPLRILTPQAPLGRELLGARVGDAIEGPNDRELVIDDAT